MAATRPSGCGSQDILGFCKEIVKNDIETCIDPDGKKNDGVNILRRNKDLKRGDFLAVVRSWKSGKRKSARMTHGGANDETRTARGQIPANEKAAVESLKFESLAPFQASVCELTAGNDILIKLQRPQMCQKVISAVHTAGSSYGQSATPNMIPCGSSLKTKQACINVADLMDSADWPGFSVSHLRSLLLSDHVAGLLQAAGYELDFVKYKLHPDLRRAIEVFNISCLKYDPTQHENVREPGVEGLKNEVHQFLRDSQYYVSLEKQREQLEIETSNGHKKHDAPDCDHGFCEEMIDRHVANDMDFLSEAIDPTILNLRDFLKEKECTLHFDKNIKVADYSLGSDRLAELAYLENDRRLQNKAFDVMVHIAPQEKSFYLQTLDIGWQMFMDLSGCAIKQLEVVHGPVGSRGGQIPLFKAEDLITLRRRQMRSASVMKYGDMVQGAGWEATIQALTVAGIKFEILSTSCRQPVKLDMSMDLEECLSSDNRGGVFVMYNCARLSNLLSNYGKEVENGVYPSLPSADSLDFSLLREEEEWALVFNYLLPFPSLVHECVAALEDQVGMTRPQIHVHKISQFLQDLSRDLSSYYSRVHVLGEPRPHLYPVMFCRLHLLKALQQVMHNALQMLCIVPLTQL